MKRILSLILVAAMLLSVLVSAGITASAAETVVVDFDNATNFVAHFNTSMSIEGTNIKQGTGSMRLDFAIPTGQASNIGGMVVYTAPTSIDLSAYTTATLDVWFPGKMSGSQGIQVNFATGASNQDGFNYMYAVDNFEAGWHTITFDLTNPPVSVNGASWATIDVVRITWFNNAQISTPNFMLLDNLKAFDSASAGNTPSTTAAAPYKSGTELIVNDADSTNGWSCDFGGTISAGTQVKAGGSVSLKTENILDNAGLVGGMAHISLPVTNMSGYKDISFDVYFDQALVGAHQLQINFASNNEEDGLFGANTRNETHDLQELLVLKEDGIAGYNSIQAVFYH